MGQTSQDELVCKLEVSFKGKLGPKLLSLVGRPFDRVLRYDQEYGFYIDMFSGLDVGDEELAILKVEIEVLEEDLSRIPSEGAVIAVCNHPFGGIEALILATVLRSVRKDARVIGDRLLERMSENNDSFVLADPLQKGASSEAVLKECAEWVRNGGLLAVHPAREVPDVDLKRRAVADPKWRTRVARLIREAEAPVLPIFFSGCDEALFHILELIQYRLSSAVPPRELFNRQEKVIQVRVGSLIRFKKLASFKNDKDMAAYLRMRTYILDNRGPDEGAAEASASAPKVTREAFEEIAPPQDPKQVAREVAALPPEDTLVDADEFSVLLVEAHQVPRLMQEMGRLREVTFRSVGEGTGKGRDLDKFDDYYKHLIVWSKEKGELVGAYRLGLTDEILARFGKDGLYTSTLFKFKSRMLDKINPAVELGRSFIRTEYQRNYAPLMLLWKGIGQFVLENPDYKFLFGPVSINEEYNSTSRQLMIQFLKQNNYMEGLAKLVKAKTPVKAAAIKGVDKNGAGLLVDIDELSAIISEIEAEQKAVPILLKQYLRLGGKLLGCNIDPDFSNVLDALLLVDLTETDPRILIRYMGRERAEGFLAYHNKSLPPASA